MDSAAGSHDERKSLHYLQKKTATKADTENSQKMRKVILILSHSHLTIFLMVNPFPPEDHHSAPATKCKSLKAGSYLPGVSR